MPAPVSGADPFTCLDCVHDPLPVDWCVAWGEYRGGLERLLRAFKFGRHDFLAEPLAGLLARAADARGDLSFDALTAVPMRPASERRRGYNQSDLLARALASHLGIPCEPLLVRRGTQAKQSTLPRRARAANVRHAFSASPLAAGKRVLIVDDICTTGETLRACAAALRAAGASGVAAITVAKAL